MLRSPLRALKYCMPLNEPQAQTGVAWYGMAFPAAACPFLGRKFVQLHVHDWTGCPGMDMHGAV